MVELKNGASVGHCEQEYEFLSQKGFSGGQLDVETFLGIFESLDSHCPDS